jgi:predicted transposase/invertase (TIGR01784 family)
MNDAERTAYYRYMKEAVSETEHLQAAEKKGREEGKAEGAKEKNIEIAKKMLNEGCSQELISKVTGLTREDLRRVDK